VSRPYLNCRREGKNACTAPLLVGVLERIAATLHEKGSGALLSQDLKKAAMERVFGFEILPAPFVVAHLQLGLLLQNLGAPLSEKSSERARVFLTNSLTGWEPPKEPKQILMFSELQEERDAAEEVKRDKPILVILEALGLTLESALAILGERTFVYLNGTAYWRNVPARVWEYTLGGYQVVKKWLSISRTQTPRPLVERR
jgi:hypothetical protein